MTEVNITPETPQQTQAEIDAMVAKAEGKEAPKAAPNADPERPAWLPEKFATPEDMAKAYAEAEKKLSAPKEDDNASNETPDPASADADKAAAEAVSAAGLDMDALGEKIIANGELEASDYEALAKQGISKEMVSQYVAGQQALADKLVSDMHAEVGGEENFNGLLEWAGENLTPGEIAAFNNTVDTGTPEAVKLALNGLASKRTSVEGSNPNLIGGRKGSGVSTDKFRSTAELTKAMADPRYARDAAYRQDVQDKLARSEIM